MSQDPYVLFLESKVTGEGNGSDESQLIKDGVNSFGFKVVTRLPPQDQGIWNKML